MEHTGERNFSGKKRPDPCEPDTVLPLAQLRILLVEDSPDNQALFKRMLSGMGARVDLAENGMVALHKWKEMDYDVVLMDIRMPFLDGYQATAGLRRSGFSGPIIAVTAHAMPGEEERCRASGCSHFLTKPVDRHTLLDTVRNAYSDCQSGTGER